MSPRAPLVVAAAVAVAGVVGAVVYFRGAPKPPEATAPAKNDPAAPADDAITNEEERIAYVAQHVVAKDLTIGPKPKPGEDAGVLPGLLQVNGAIVNEGPKALRSVRVVIFLKDAKDAVIGTYIDDVLDGKRLGPGESRAFALDVPEKREYAGRFSHALR